MATIRIGTKVFPISTTGKRLLFQYYRSLRTYRYRHEARHVIYKDFI